MPGAITITWTVDVSQEKTAADRICVEEEIKKLTSKESIQLWRVFVTLWKLSSKRSRSVAFVPFISLTIRKVWGNRPAWQRKRNTLQQVRESQDVTAIVPKHMTITKNVPLNFHILSLVIWRSRKQSQACFSCTSVSLLTAVQLFKKKLHVTSIFSAGCPTVQTFCCIPLNIQTRGISLQSANSLL